MTLPEHFEIIGGRGFFRPVGNLSLDAAVDLVGAAIGFARSKGIHKLLVNVTALTGFPSPTISQRFFLVEKWVVAAAGAVQLAMVASAEMIDPHKFGVTVAVNRGLIAEVFTSESEALEWLDSLG